MPTQIVEITTNSPTTQEDEVFQTIADTMPVEALNHIVACRDNGTLVSSIACNNGIFTITNQWAQQQAEEYRDLMVGVSQATKSTLVNKGWTITFNIETANL